MMLIDLISTIFHDIQGYYGFAPGFCLRFDVDGILWRPDDDSKGEFSHEVTFNALGFVKASKTLAKYTCAANGKFNDQS